MIGFYTYYDTSFLLNRLDVLGCILLIIRFVFLILIGKIHLTFTIIIQGIIAFVFLRISEYDKSRDTRTRYVITHSIWHIFIFFILYQLLLDV